MNKWYMEFMYNDLGRGELILNEGNIPVFSYQARTGSIGHDGRLKNALKAGIYYLKEPSVETDEIAMVVETGKPARKIRLYNPEWTRLLIHADGNMGGTDGCIGTDPQYGNATGLYVYLDNVIRKHGEIKVFVNKPVPKGLRNGTRG